MARALRIQYPGAYYHITCRGNERRKIFVSSQDREVFLEKLALSLDIYNVSLLAYVCMPNHFHLLLTTPEGNLSEFMRHFNISYTAAFNYRHNRVGHLYQGRYKSFLIDADNYLMEVSRYLHLNPVRTDAFAEKSTREKWNFLLEYEWSSLLGYLSANRRKDFIHYQAVLNYMGGDNRRGRQEYRRFLNRGLENELKSPLITGKGHGIVGDDDFIAWIRGSFLDGKASGREQPALKELRKKFEPEVLINHFAHLVGKDREEICRRGKHSLERAMLMELLYRFCRSTQPEIGKLVGGIDYSAVSRIRKKLHIRLSQEKGLKKRFDRLAEQLLQKSRVKI